MTVTRYGLLFLCLPFTGCAYLTNYTAPINLRDGSVAIDVKQRVVFSQSRNDDKRSHVVVCAEPSPDALTVIGVSGGFSLSDGTGKSGNAAAALSESGASIGLRTQSIQLLRDAMYRLCEGYAGGAVTATDFAAMQRRYQSTMMGLIAIEQLTGPVVASQAFLKSSAMGQSGASAGDATVDSAQTKLDLASEAVLRAQTELETSQTKVRETRDEIRKEDAKGLDEKRKAEAAKRPVDQTLIDSSTERLKVLAGEERAALNDVSDKKRRLDDAERRRQEFKAEVTVAKARVSASVAGGGGLGEMARATQGSNEALANAVTKIVEEINRSYSKDGCLALVTELVKDPVSIQRLANVDTASKVDDKTLAEAEKLVQSAARNLATARAEESFAKGRVESAKPDDKNAAIADAVLTEGRTDIAKSALANATEEVKRLKSDTNDRASAVAVLKTSLSVCQRILGEEEKKLEAKSNR